MDVHMLSNYCQYILYPLGTICIALLIKNFVRLFLAARCYSSQSSSFNVFKGPKPHWLFGNLREFPPGKGYINRIKWAKEFGPVYKFHSGPYYRRFIVADPECIRLILNTADPKDPLAYAFAKPWLGDGLLISKGKKWSRNRRLLTPSFHFDILKPYQKIFSNSAHIMMKKWKKHLNENPSTPIEMFDCVSLMTLDSLMKCIFGIDEDFQEHFKQHPYIKTVYELSNLISIRFSTLFYFNDTFFSLTRHGRNFQKARKYAQTFSKSLITKKRKEKSNGGNISSKGKYLDFLDTLLDCKDVDGNGMSDQEIQDEVDTFLFEGHDTTASGISWCLYNLARHPEYQQKCRNEVNVVIGEKDEISSEDTGKLPYLTMCIKESLRMHNPVGAIGRQLTKAIPLPDGRSIPAGATVSIDIHTCHHNPNVWPDPETYDPDRFLPENTKGRHSHAFVGFSAGPRNCIGQHFAMNEMKTVISLVLKNFYLKVHEGKSADPFQALILRSENGIWLDLKPVGG